LEAFAEGTLQIFRIHEQNNLTQFLKYGEVDPMQYGIKSISWNKCGFEREMIVVGGNNKEDGYKSPLD
jgi:hypothetical protein